jgi:hypothetical protein
MKSDTPHLDVSVAERSAHRAHGITNGDVAWVRPLESHVVGELGFRGSGVRNDSGTVDGVRALSGVHVLPRPPDAVDLAVVEEEPWVTYTMLVASHEYVLAR